VGRESIEELGHQRKVDHGGLVHDHHVVGERVRCIMLWHTTRPPKPKKPVQRVGLVGFGPLKTLKARVFLEPFLKRLRNSLCRLSSGSGKRNERRGIFLRKAPKEQADGVCLACPRSARDHRKAMTQGHKHRDRLPVRRLFPVLCRSLRIR
jgi:hypothetical protein